MIKQKYYRIIRNNEVQRVLVLEENDIILSKGYCTIFEETGDNAPDKSLTKQKFKNDTDIKTMLKRARKGIQPNFAHGKPTYGGYAGKIEYQDALTKVNRAQEDFNALPSETRNYFHNNPGELIDYLSNLNSKDKVEKALELKLLTREGHDEILQRDFPEPVIEPVIEPPVTPEVPTA